MISDIFSIKKISKSLYVFILTLLFLTTFSLKAQQNFFNVPNSEITHKGKIFFQQQINLMKHNINFNTTFNFGLGNNWEVGANVNSLSFVDYRKLEFEHTIQPYNPFFCINAQKKIHLSENTSMSMGTQMAASITSPVKWGNYTYFNTRYHTSKVIMVGGLYFATDSYFGEGTRDYIAEKPFNKIGFQYGFEYRFNPKLSFQLDIISGKNAMSLSVFGGAYYLNKYWILSGGYGVPFFNHTSPKTFVLELTFIPE